MFGTANTWDANIVPKTFKLIAAAHSLKCAVAIDAVIEQIFWILLSNHGEVSGFWSLLETIVISSLWWYANNAPSISSHKRSDVENRHSANLWQKGLSNKDVAFENALPLTVIIIGTRLVIYNQLLLDKKLCDL